MKIMNASGCHCTTKQELIDLYMNKYCNMIVSKSCTIKPLEGNPEPRYYENENLSINSTGLRNKGLHFYLSMVKVFHELNISNNLMKIYIISYADLANIKLFINIISNYYSIHKIPLYFELNLSCPNIPGKGQIGYDFEESYKLLDYVFKNIDPELIKNREINIGVKLPPYFDTIHFKKITDVLNCFPLSHITCINSLGNGFVFNEDLEQSVAGNNGYGGIGGSVVKPFGLSNVRKFRELLSNRIRIYGCGGIITGYDIYEYELCGAEVVQIGTELIKAGVGIFKHLSTEYKLIRDYINLIHEENESNNNIVNSLEAKNILEASKHTVNSIKKRSSREKLDLHKIIDDMKKLKTHNNNNSYNDKINTM